MDRRSTAFITDDDDEGDEEDDYKERGAIPANRRPSSISNEQARAILFSPQKEQLFFIRIGTEDETFSTLLKKPLNFTVQELVNLLIKKYKFNNNIIIVLEQEDEMIRFLNHHDHIIAIQNKILKMNGFDETEAPNAVLTHASQVNFKFLIHTP